MQSATVTQTPDGTFTVEGIGPRRNPESGRILGRVVTRVPIDGIENGTIFTKIRGRVAEDTMKINGKTVQTVHAVVSPDGKTVTATIDGTDIHGRPMITSRPSISSNEALKELERAPWRETNG